MSTGPCHTCGSGRTVMVDGQETCHHCKCMTDAGYAILERMKREGQEDPRVAAADFLVNHVGWSQTEVSLYLGNLTTAEVKT